MIRKKTNRCDEASGVSLAAHVKPAGLYLSPPSSKLPK